MTSGDLAARDGHAFTASEKMDGSLGLIFFYRGAFPFSEFGFHFFSFFFFVLCSSCTRF